MTFNRFQNLKNLGLVIAALSLCACQEKEKKQTNFGDFVGYAVLFEKRAAEYGSPLKIDDLIIRWGDLSNEYENGICEIHGKSTPVITIDVYAWDEMDESEREALLFHEMGHCVLKRLHKNGYITLGVPESVMNAYAFDGSIYSNYEHHYLSELYSIKGQF